MCEFPDTLYRYDERRRNFLGDARAERVEKVGERRGGGGDKRYRIGFWNVTELENKDEDF